MREKVSCAAYDFWTALHNAPYHFPMDADTWDLSMHEDVDSDGRLLFNEIHTKVTDHAVIQYGITAFGFDENGEISDRVHYGVIRDLCFAPGYEADGQKLLNEAMRFFKKQEKVYAFFHYFGMSACARHGKLHESQGHIHNLLLKKGFTVEHENIYYSRTLNGIDVSSSVSLRWKAMNEGNCREFAAVADGCEVGWGQVHFLPQGDIAYLRWIYIDEKRQHQSFGTAIMQQLFAELYQMGIRRFDTDTALDNIAAQGYYEKCGFIKEGITRSYYMG